MPKLDITGCWTGEYSYDPNEHFEKLPPPVKFTFTAQPGWFGRFRGTIQDDPIIGVPGEARIVGRVKGQRLKFLKQYSQYYTTNSEGRHLTIKEKLEMEHNLVLERHITPPKIF